MPVINEYVVNLSLDYCGSGSSEWLYYLYISIFKSLSLSFSSFIFATSILHFYLLIKVARKLDYPNKFLIGYFCTVGFYFQFWYLKQGIATLIILLGIFDLYNTSNQKKKGLILCFAAALIHSSSIYILITYAFIRKFNIKFLITIILIFSLIYIYDPNFFIKNTSILELISSTKYSGYLDSEFDKSQLGLISVLCIILIFSNLIYKSIDNIGLNLMAIGILTIIIFGPIQSSGRLSSYYMPLGIIIYFQFLIKRYMNNYIINILYFGFLIIYFIKTFIIDEYNLNQIKSII
jgi:hypothetical protein